MEKNSTSSKINNLTVNSDKTIEFDSYFSASVSALYDNQNNPKVDAKNSSDDDDYKGKEFYCHLKFTAENVSGRTAEREGVQYDIINVEYIPTNSCKREIVNQLFHGSENSYLFFLPLLPTKADEAAALARGFIGEPSFVEGNIWRMFYLSIVVLTTLGLGDIVPITPAARGLVGFEAVLGVVLVGLFINAVAWRANQGGKKET